MRKKRTRTFWIILGRTGLLGIQMLHRRRMAAQAGRTQRKNREKLRCRQPNHSRN